MINVLHGDGDTAVLEVCGNRSMSWRANLWLLASLALIALVISVLFALMGLWLVLPFAGAELLAVAVGLYKTSHKLSWREIIRIERHHVCVEAGRRYPECRLQIPRAWCRLRFLQKESPFDVGQLALLHHARAVPLGALLGRDEKQVLYRYLHAYLPATV